MFKLTAHLSPTESQVLTLLSRSRTYLEIAERLQTSPENIHTVACRLRKKTGITNTMDPEECKEFIAQRRTPPRHTPLQPTETQLRAMRLYAQHIPYPEIAARMGLHGLSGSQMAQNLVSIGASRAGIKNAGRYRFQLVCEYLAQLDAEKAPSPMDDPAFS